MIKDQLLWPETCISRLPQEGHTTQVGLVTKTKVAQQYSQVAREIRSVVSESGEASAPTSSNLSIVSQQENPSNLWMFNQFVLSTYNMTLEDMKNSMVLNSGSSTHLFCRPDWLANLRALQKAVELSTNGGPLTVTDRKSVV